MPRKVGKMNSSEFKEGRDLQTSSRCPVSCRAAPPVLLAAALPLPVWVPWHFCARFIHLCKKGHHLIPHWQVFSDPSAKNCSNTWGVLLKSTVLCGEKTQNITQEVNQAKQRNYFFSTMTYESLCLILPVCWAQEREGFEFLWWFPLRADWWMEPFSSDGSIKSQSCQSVVSTHQDSSHCNGSWEMKYEPRQPHITGWSDNKDYL